MRPVASGGLRVVSAVDHHGQMLVVVLWVMGLVSLAVGGVAARSMHELRLGQVPLELVQAHAIAEAGLYQAIALIELDDPAVDHLQETWATGIDPDTHAQLLAAVPVGLGVFSVGVEGEAGLQPGLIDEERKLHLNSDAATVDALRQLIAAVALPGVDAQAVATAIVAWRTSCEELPAPCHGGGLDTVEELLLVPGVTPELFTQLEPSVTVHSSEAVNVNTAPAVVLTALDCDGAALVEQRRPQPDGNGPFASPPAQCPATVVSSTAFTVPITTTLSQRSGRTIRLRAVIDRSGRVLAWVLR